MKKHEELRQRTNVYTNVADYIDRMIEEEAEHAERYEERAKQAKADGTGDEAYYLEQKEICEIKEKFYKALYDMICKEVK